MSRYYSYLNTTKEVVANYNGEIPLAAWLKQFFATRKQMGSRDRREVSAMVYQYYRLGKLIDATFEERIAAALFLCRQEPSELLGLLNPTLNEQITLPTKEKVALITTEDIGNIFPFIDEIEQTTKQEAFYLSHLIQPDLFIRIRPKHGATVRRKLQEHGIAFKELENDCLSFSNATALDTVLSVDKEVVIQDYSSQQVGSFLSNLKNIKNVWDCCAASGGKSILAVDILGKLNLTLSDKRPTIINNLRKRLDRAGINQHKVFAADITKPFNELKGEKFDLIICDAPCSGSGTWGRMPENLGSFKKESIGEYAELQRKIVTNAIPYLATKGYFLYITCSVYKAENEEVVSYILTKFPHLSLVKKQLIEGYEKRADTMYAALFQ